MSAPLRAWFVEWFSSAYHHANLLRNSPDDLSVCIVGSHRDPEAVMLAACDEVVDIALEGSDDAVADLLVECCLAEHIDVLVPRRRLLAVSHRRSQFEAGGTRLFVAGPTHMIEVAQDKLRLYEEVGTIGSQHVPPVLAASSGAEFEEALTRLRAFGPLCWKPRRGEGGSGFRVLDPTVSLQSALLGTPDVRVSSTGLALALREPWTLGSLVVTPYLEGVEYSVDCLAVDGTVIAQVVRHKRAPRVQQIERRPEVELLVEQIVELLDIDGLVNLQFIVPADGIPRLIDLNPRMSAGLDVSAAAVNLPLLALRRLLGHDLGDVASVAPTSVTRLEMRIGEIQLPTARRTSSIVGPTIGEGPVKGSAKTA